MYSVLGSENWTVSLKGAGSFCSVNVLRIILITFQVVLSVHFMLRTINNAMGVQIPKSVYMSQISTVSLIVHSCFLQWLKWGKWHSRKGLNRSILILTEILEGSLG